MKTLFGWMVTTFLFISVGCYAWMHMRHVAETVAAPVAVRQQGADRTSSESPDTQPAVTMAGPLADFMQGQSASKAEKIQTITYTPVPSDHVGGSVVGTSTTLLRQTFVVAGTVDLPFEVPAHAYNPHLHGTFRSFTQAGGKLSSGAVAVEFVLLNDEQFSDFLHGRPSESVFSADAAHDQEVNANLPPTLADPVKYHLIFRNGSRATGKKVVQADFQIDY